MDHKNKKQKFKPKTLSQVIKIEELIQRSRLNLSRKMYQKSLKYNLYIINSMIFNKNTHLVAKFKDYMIADYIEEFLKRIYKLNETEERIPRIVNYYKNYLKFFCNPLFCDFVINNIVQSLGDCKAELYYKTNYGNKKKQKDNDIDFNISEGKPDINRDEEVKNGNIFTASLKKEIDKIKRNEKSLIFEKLKQSFSGFENDLSEMTLKFQNESKIHDDSIYSKIVKNLNFEVDSKNDKNKEMKGSTVKFNYQKYDNTKGIKTDKIKTENFMESKAAVVEQSRNKINYNISFKSLNSELHKKITNSNDKRVLSNDKTQNKNTNNIVLKQDQTLFSKTRNIQSGLSKLKTNSIKTVSVVSHNIKKQDSESVGFSSVINYKSVDSQKNQPKLKFTLNNVVKKEISFNEAFKNDIKAKINQDKLVISKTPIPKTEIINNINININNNINIGNGFDSNAVSNLKSLFEPSSNYSRNKNTVLRQDSSFKTKDSKENQERRTFNTINDQQIRNCYTQNQVSNEVVSLFSNKLMSSFENSSKNKLQSKVITRKKLNLNINIQEKNKINTKLNNYVGGLKSKVTVQKPINPSTNPNSNLTDKTIPQSVLKSDIQTSRLVLPSNNPTPSNSNNKKNIFSANIPQNNNEISKRLVQSPLRIKK